MLQRQNQRWARWSVSLGISSVFLGACAPKAWIVETGEREGRVAYQPDLSPEEKVERLKRLIPCADYVVVVDEVHSGGPSTIETIPLTIQDSHKMGANLGTQSPTAGALGSYKDSASSPAIPSTRIESPLDPSYRVLTYRCP